MPDDHVCPIAHCGREKRTRDVVCRRCWYVVPDDLKQSYRDALTALRASKNSRNIQAILVAKVRILESINPKGNPS